MRSVAVVRLVACVASIVAIALYVTTGSADAAAMPKSFAQAGNDAERTLLGTYYAGDGLWRACDSAACDKSNSDWGDDSATYALYLRWSSTHDARLASILGSLGKTGIRYGSPCAALPCGSWSDVPEWDTIALVRDYQATRDAQALERARAAFRFIDEARVFRLGACPTIQYQMPGGKPGYLLKTLETDANYIKAALLLYQATHESEYLDAAVIRYAAVRRYFLDPTVPLYSVYVYDDGRRCRQLPHRFFASVNGDMIWSGLALSRLTGAAAYRAQALKTAHAVDEHLCDAAGVFADLQAENDVEEPLVEAMYVLASDYGQVFARRWIARNAAAALSARAPDGAFERFWDGPPSRSASISIWQSTGGIALEFAAAALQPSNPPAVSHAWDRAAFVVHRVSALPATISFTGSAIALIGTMGAKCCQAGHAAVLLDGAETFDRTGIWQNKSMTGSVPGTVLFAWRWRKAGHHAITLVGGVPNAKEGGAFIALDGYVVKR